VPADGVIGDSMPSLAYRRYVLGLLAVVYVVNFMDRNILTILLQPIKDELALSDTQLGLLSGIAFALFYVTLGVPIARLADRHNRVNIISFSILLWSLMTAACGLASNFVQLFLARIGVGIGEAGCTPPAHSLIADYFESSTRSTALGIYSLGLPLGSFMGILAGGWLAELYGWRIAFMAVGLPGLALALLVKLSVREPIRGLMEDIKPTVADPPPVRVVFGYLWRRKTFVHITLATSLLAFTSFGTGTWIPPFLIRSHGMGLGEVGTVLAVLTIAAGVAGTVGGGVLGDRLTRRDPRWHVWLPVIFMLSGIAFFIAGLLVDNAYLALTLWFLPTLSFYVYVGPVMALIQLLATVRIRAMIVAIFFFFTNIIGMGLGPLMIGWISDVTSQYFGTDSLRYALLISSVFMLWASAHYLLAAKSIRSDLALSAEERR
jgi:MFS family permease